VSDKLQKKISLVFDNEPLDKTMQIIAGEIGVPIEILGGDLQLDGITKNQAIRGIALKETAAEQVLLEIFLKANPDGKLVYLVKPKAPGGPEMIFITTRTQAEKRKDKLPPSLAAPPNPKTTAKK